jgi:RP/EB family microtubule-associated protein
MGESRQELVNWVNTLLELNITKVEQCGTGAVYCQLFDSVHMDVPMSKVKFNVNTEYQYLNNFKVLQSAFTKHQIDRSVPVERLVKCRFQDNLEFLQWFKRYWDANFSGEAYDPVARRKGQAPVGGSRQAVSSASSSTAAGASVSRTSSSARTTRNNTPSTTTTRSTATRAATTGSTAAPRRTASSSSNSGYSTPTAGGPAARKPVGTTAAAGNGSRVSSGSSRTTVKGRSTPSGGSAAAAPASKATIEALHEAREYAATLEQENEDMARDFELIRAESAFYFDKLRDIELLVLTASQLLAERKAANVSEDGSETTLADAAGITADMKALGITEEDTTNTPELALFNIENFLNEVQTILYSTAEGFARPEDIQEGEDEDEGYEKMDLEETF